MWQQEAIPQELKDASIVHLYKRKGNRWSCDNHRGISLLVIAGKILARVLLNRLTHHMEDGRLPESQCGFRQGRGTVDMIFAARQLQEKFQEQHRDHYTTFVDLTKAFDTVSREGLWKIMGKFGCQTSSSAWCGSSMMACMLEYWMMAIPLTYSRLQMELNKAVSLHPHSSAWCSQPCCQMPSATMTCPASRLDSGQMASYLTIGTFMQSPRLERTRCVTSYLQTTAHSMLPQRTTCSRT